jgi:hypothetical protein
MSCNVLFGVMFIGCNVFVAASVNLLSIMVLAKAHHGMNPRYQFQYIFTVPN